MSKLAAPVSDLTLAALRSEIDAVDDAVLVLIRRRQMLARKINTLKGPLADGLKLRPDREAHVLRRLLTRAPEEDRELVQALWRELLSAGLAVQGEVTVVVWSPAPGAVDQARLRFGVSARYESADSASEALARAQRESAIAVLALHPDTPWWAGLPQRAPLWIFESLGEAGETSALLAVGRIPPESLERGTTYRVSDTAAAGERVVATAGGRVLTAAPDGAAPAALDRAQGVVGSAPG